MCFTIFQNEKTLFQAIKTASSKSGKIVISVKGLTLGFGPKLAISQSFFRHYSSGKCVLRYSRTKKRLLGYKNSMFKKWKNLDFCEGVNPWFWSKIGHFSIFCFQALQPRKMCFTIFQNEKTPFQAIKIACSKSGKIQIFAKGLTLGFGPKLPFFHLLFLGNIFQENVFYDTLELKNAFLGYKNSMFKKWKNLDFCEGVNPWFWSKIGHFSIFLF